MEEGQKTETTASIEEIDKLKERVKNLESERDKFKRELEEANKTILSMTPKQNAEKVELEFDEIMKRGS